MTQTIPARQAPHLAIIAIQEEDSPTERREVGIVVTGAEARLLGNAIWVETFNRACLKVELNTQVELLLSPYPGMRLMLRDYILNHFTREGR